MATAIAYSEFGGPEVLTSMEVETRSAWLR